MSEKEDPPAPAEEPATPPSAQMKGPGPEVVWPSDPRVSHANFLQISHSPDGFLLNFATAAPAVLQGLNGEAPTRQQVFVQASIHANPVFFAEILRIAVDAWESYVTESGFESVPHAKLEFRPRTPAPVKAKDGE